MIDKSLKGGWDAMDCVSMCDINDTCDDCSRHGDDCDGVWEVMHDNDTNEDVYVTRKKR